MTKYKILITRELTPSYNTLIENLEDKFEIIWHKQAQAITRESLLKLCPGIHGIICTLEERIDYEFLSTCGPQLKVVSSLSGGFDHMKIKDIQRFEDEHNIKIELGHTPAASTDAISELNIGLALTIARRLYEAQRIVIEGEWKFWSPNWLLGFQLSQKTIGIIGFGKVGQATYSRLLSFNPKKVLYTKRTEIPEKLEKLEYSSLDTLLKESDLVFITISLNEKTHGLLNREKLSIMKPNAILINTSRGAIINQSDLLESLRSGHLGGVALDVCYPEPLPKDHPLLVEFPYKVMIVPHIGSATIEARDEMARIATENLLRGLKDSKLLINVPRN